MARPTPTPGELGQAFSRAHALQAELARHERAVGRSIETLARGLASLMAAGDHLHRIGVGIHAFAVDGAVCLAGSYLEEEGDGYRYRYAVLCGGANAVRALRTAALDPSDSDPPGAQRRVARATYSDYDDFLYRLPKYVGDINRRLEERTNQASKATGRVVEGRRLLSTARHRRSTNPP